MSVALILRSKTQEFLGVTLYGDQENAVKDMFVTNDILKRFNLCSEFEVVVVTFIDSREAVNEDIIEYLGENPCSAVAKVIRDVVQTSTSEEVFYRLWQEASEGEWRLNMIKEAMQNPLFAQKVRVFLSIFLEPSAEEWAIFAEMP